MEKLIVATLQEHFEKLQHEWTHPIGTSTRYFAVDNLLPHDIAMDIFNAFPHSGEHFDQRQSFREKKKTLQNLSLLPKILSDITFSLQHPDVIHTIENITGFNTLEGDPKLYAGGLSMMFPGDFLNPHIDNSHDSNRSRYRRLNLLYYVSPNWQLENGGNLELWDKKVKTPVPIESRFNRLVIMETNDNSWHSVKKVNINRPRCCVSNYYFSKASPKITEEYYHVTSFLGRPDEKLRRAYGRVDNYLRQFVSKNLGISRGRDLVNILDDEETIATEQTD